MAVNDNMYLILHQMRIETHRRKIYMLSTFSYQTFYKAYVSV